MKCIVKAKKIHYDGKFHYFGNKVTIKDSDLDRYAGLVDFTEKKSHKLEK